MTNTSVQYTKEQVQELSNKELLDEILKIGIKPRSLARLLPKYPILYEELKSRTNFLLETIPNVGISIRIHCLKNGIIELPTCRGHLCANKVSWSQRTNDFREFCSSKCSHSVKETLEKAKATCLLKYGCQNPGQSQQVKDKRKRTNLEKYGVENTFQSESIKEKIKNTNNRLYGVDHPMQNEEIKNRLKKSMMEKYGVEHSMQLESTIEKARQTSIERYGVEHSAQSKEIQNKMKQTCLNRYGVEHASQSKISKEHTKDTCQRKYGSNSPLGCSQIWEQTRKSFIENHPNNTCPMDVPSIRDNVKDKWIEKYNVDNPMKCQDIKEHAIETNLERYGVEHPLQSEKIKNKLKQTCLEKYGVSSYSQTTDFHQKCRKPYSNDKYPNMTFGSSWEFKVYDFLVEHNIEFEYQPNISFDYEYCGKIHTYHPDFKVGNKVFEVKGDYFFKLNESGQEEMFCPYRYDDWDDERYEYECKKFNTKYKCMLDNDVVILRYNQILNLTIEMFNR